MAFTIQIPTELLQDGCLEPRITTPEQWAEYVAALRTQRHAMDLSRAPRAEKVKLTWRIKKAAAFKPTGPFLRFVFVRASF